MAETGYSWSMADWIQLVYGRDWIQLAMIQTGHSLTIDTHCIQLVYDGDLIQMVTDTDCIQLVYDGDLIQMVTDTDWIQLVYDTDWTQLDY